MTYWQLLGAGHFHKWSKPRKYTSRCTILSPKIFVRQVFSYVIFLNTLGFKRCSISGMKNPKISPLKSLLSLSDFDTRLKLKSLRSFRIAKNVRVHWMISWNIVRGVLSMDKRCKHFPLQIFVKKKFLLVSLGKK